MRRDNDKRVKLPAGVAARADGGGKVSGLKFIKEQQDKGQRRLPVGGN